MSKGRRRSVITTIITVVILAVVAAALLLPASRGGADWRAFRAVAFESDDWGLCGFVPDAASLAAFDRTAFESGPFPAIYWTSTLEDGAAVDRLRRLFRACRGRDGMSAVFQPNYIVSSLSYERAPADSCVRPGPEPGWGWRERHLPATPPAYARPGLFEAVAAAIADGVWEPEFHGNYHFDPAARMDAVADPAALEAARGGVLAFPASSWCFELDSRRGIDVVRGELDRGLRIFEGLFGRVPASVVAPDYVWDRRHEIMWREAGFHVVQAKREQRRPSAGGGIVPRVAKVLERRWRKLTEAHLIYLERNCRFEPAQESPDAGTTERCLGEIRRAWDGGRPAIVETHRVNFVNLDRETTERCFDSLARLLAALVEGPGPAPHFVTDSELAQLYRDGTSWRRVGDSVIVRNATHSRRIVPVPIPGGSEFLRIPVAPISSVRVPSRPSL